MPNEQRTDFRITKRPPKPRYENMQEVIEGSVLTNINICPDLVSVEEFGDHASAVRGGRRHWQFETKEQRDRFVVAVQQGRFRRQKDETK